jgi:hypothetical protein
MDLGYRLSYHIERAIFAISTLEEFIIVGSRNVVIVLIVGYGAPIFYFIALLFRWWSS